MPTRPTLRRLAAAAALTSLALTARAEAADPPPRTLRALLPPTVGQAVDLAGVSPDGARVWFTTTQALPGTGDVNTARDVYEAAGGTIRLISSGTGTGEQRFIAATPDGSHVLFSSSVSIDPRDTDGGAFDSYVRRPDGSVRLVTPPGSSTLPSTATHISADGSRVLVETTQGFGADTDAAQDVYETDASGGFRLLSTGTPERVEADFVSADGTRAIWETESPASADDDDAEFDVYRSTAGSAPALLTPGTPTGARFAGATPDGQHVLFRATDALLPSDTDRGNDLYLRRPDGGLRFISTNGGGEVGEVRMSTDGSSVVFETEDAALRTDTDERLDVYERRADDRLVLRSPGTTDPTSIVAVDAAADAVLFASRTRLADDTDSALDLYEHGTSGPVKLVTGGLAGPSPSDVQRAAISADGARTFFVTPDGLTPTDADGAEDVHVREWAAPQLAGETTVSGTPAPGQTLACRAGDVAGEGLTTSVAWLRDGAPAAAGTRYVVGAADVGRALACRATAGNPFGSVTSTSAAVLVPGAPAGPPAVPPVAPGPGAPRPAGDTTAPRAVVTPPRCSAAVRRRPGACTRLRARRSSWTTLRGTATDERGGSGLAAVRVSVVRRTGRTCKVATGTRLASRSCAAAVVPARRATLTGGRWTLRLGKLAAGRLELRVSATDRAGNAQRPRLTVLRLR